MKVIKLMTNKVDEINYSLYEINQNKTHLQLVMRSIDKPIRKNNYGVINVHD